MQKIHLFIGIAILLWGTSTVFGQNNCWVAPCDPAPCEPNACSPCDPCGTAGSLFTFGGWVETGIYVNSHGSRDNGLMHTESNRRTDFLMNQLYFYGEKEMDTSRGFDWGARADLVYGVDGPSMQCYGDETFDFGWGTNRHGYGMSAYQVYGTLGYKDLNVLVGKFIGKVGWEESASKNNFFYSHSYCYWIEPATHTGVLATYDMTDRLSLSAGWTSGADCSFQNPDRNSTVLTGFTYALSDDATVYYWINAGKLYNKTTDYFIQSVCFEWALTDRVTHVLQYNLRNDNERGGDRYSSYGINNHLLYKWNDQWGAGMRFEWLRDNGGNSGLYVGIPGDYYEFTLGLNWNPLENVSVRPEVRYDWCRGGATPFADGTQKDQVTGGVGLLVSF